MLKTIDKGKKAQLILDSSSSESDSEGEAVNVGKNVKLVGKTKVNRKSGNASEEFTINKGYADRYDNWRNLEEMQKLKNRLGINDISELKEEDSSSESSSDDEEEWSTEKEKAFLKTLACLKTKDPKIYSDEFGFFKSADNNATNGTEDPQDASKKKKGDKKPFTVRDHDRTMILEKAGRESEEDDNENGNQKLQSYPEELASIKTEFSKALDEIDSSDEDDGLLGSNLLKRRANKSTEEKQKEDDEYKLWLKGELEKVEKGKLSKDDVRELKSLREYWNDDKLDEGEKFLRDYILNKKYIDPLKEEKDYIPSYNEVVHDDDDLSNDEKFEAEREEFEHKYNFRFEEPDQDFIKRYPRTIQESMRREDTKRKEQRQKAKDRKDELKARKKEEVQRLKALKRKEIMDKIQKLHEISGDPNLNLSEIDIDGDFDPEEYDRRMQEIFNDDYYQEGPDEEKPVFDFDPAIDEEDENWEKWVPARGDDEAVKEELEGTDDEDGKEEDDDASHKKEDAEFFGRRGRRAATEKELIEASKGKRGRKKRNVFLDALEREKPKFDPKYHKSFEKYFEEYYNLDFEDVIGDVKCRFKYHKTTANDFGLTTEEILKAEDKELNQWASLKKTFQYRGEDEEQYEVQAYRKKAEREDLKKRVLLSVYQSTQDKNYDEKDDEEDNANQKKKRKKNKKKSTTQGNTDEIKIESNEVKDVNSKKSPEKASTPPVNVKKNVPSVETKSESKKRAAAELSSDTKDSPSTPKLSKRQRKNRKKLARPETEEGQEKPSPVKQEKPSSKHKKEFKNNKSKQHFDKDKRGTKRKAVDSNEKNGITLDEDRLRSYGLNPKKFKKQMKYGNSAAKV